MNRRTLDTPADLKRRLEAEREGSPFIVFQDAEGKQRIITLDAEWERLSLGRDDACDVCIDWDSRVSRLHAQLERMGCAWAVCDGGLSRNGTFLNGVRVHGHRILKDRDELRIGATEIRFRDTIPQRTRTLIAGPRMAGQIISPAQRKVLVALCRPYKRRSPSSRPASNREIADDLVLSVESVKSHLRVLFAKFGLDKLPQNEKRIRLVEHALERGLVRESEL